MVRKKKKNISYFFVILLLLVGAYLYLRHVESPTGAVNPIKESNDLEKTIINYGHQVDSISKKLELPPSYFKALIVLECSGRKEFTPRFESHVFKKLKEVRERERKQYNGIKYRDIHDASDDALRNLATSWGPFQLMGYQCMTMGVNVQDIRGKDAVYWGMIWINKRYGKRLKKGQFKDAFHIHNTGRPYPAIGAPKTHDPRYVERGLSYMEYFQNL